MENENENTLVCVTISSFTQINLINISAKLEDLDNKRAPKYPQWQFVWPETSALLRPDLSCYLFYVLCASLNSVMTVS